MSLEIIEEFFEVNETPKLIVKNVRGIINISRGDAHEIKVKVIKHLNHGDFGNTVINVEKTSENVVLVEAKYDINKVLPLTTPGKVEFIIEIPENTSIRANAVSSSVEISGINSDLKIKTISGKVTLSEVLGDIFVKTVSGGVYGDQLEGDIQTTTVSGKVMIEGSELKRMECKTVSGSIFAEELTFGEGPYTFDTVSGKTTLIAPKENGCTVRASTVSGVFKTNLKVNNGKIGRKKWHINLQGGGPEIKLKSVSGSLYLLTEKGAIASKPKEAYLTSSDRIEILEKLENNEATIEETLKSLS